MARERQGTQSSTATGGLLSGVFSFVSREIESFVTSATGGEVRCFNFIINNGCGCLKSFVDPKS